jgi:hypothetical protein
MLFWLEHMKKILPLTDKPLQKGGDPKTPWKGLKSPQGSLNPMGELLP